MGKAICPVLVAAVALITSHAAFGADLGYVSAYSCEGTDINGALVKECASRYPALAGRASAVWDSWLKRNSDDSKKALQQCSDELHRENPTEQSFEEAQAQIKQLKSKIVGLYPEMVKLQGESFCKQFLDMLESGENDISRLIESKAYPSK